MEQLQTQWCSNGPLRQPERAAVVRRFRSSHQRTADADLRSYSVTKWTYASDPLRFEQKEFRLTRGKSPKKLLEAVADEERL
jgi:hypothetical protein